MYFKPNNYEPLWHPTDSDPSKFKCSPTTNNTRVAISSLASEIPALAEGLSVFLSKCSISGGVYHSQLSYLCITYITAHTPMWFGKLRDLTAWCVSGFYFVL